MLILCTETMMESWQNGYCTGLENRRPKGLGGSNPSLSAKLRPTERRWDFVWRAKLRYAREDGR